MLTAPFRQILPRRIFWYVATIVSCLLVIPTFSQYFSINIFILELVYKLSGYQLGIARGINAHLIQHLMNDGGDVSVLGLRGRGITGYSLAQAYQEMDLRRLRPKRQWFMEFVEMADALAKHAPTWLLEHRPEQVSA